ncbi:MAG: septum formation initiator family protein [Thermodesulfobacteriota bacterium]|nr:septum formation initiator family protein [Thermodesulfobacteriota bacterium]
MREKNSNFENKKWLFVSVILILLFILWHVISPNGALKYYNIRKQIDENLAKNEILKKENNALRKEIDKLENDPLYIEKTAREKYGMIKKNEILYKIKENEKVR